MSTELITFKHRQIASLRESDDALAAGSIARLESEIRALEGTSDDPRDGEILRLRADLTAALEEVRALRKPAVKPKAKPKVKQ